jgi:hypothetical protein
MASQASIADVRSETFEADGDGRATARRFAWAIMVNDRRSAVALLAPAIRFRHLIPRVRERSGAPTRRSTSS